MTALTPSILRTLVPDYQDWPIFIETGTYHGETIFAMESLFDELHTIELGPDLWRDVTKSYSGTKIQFWLGESSAVLPKLLPQIRRSTIFFLDGHWSCCGTARGSVDVPLLEELSIICETFYPPAVVIIDDLRLFEQGPHSGEPVDWKQISREAVEAIASERLIGYTADCGHDKLILRLAGL